MTDAITMTLDTTGLLCPEPVMMLHAKINDMAVGEMIRVIATDPSTERDIPKFCHFLGHSLIEQELVDNQYLYTIQKL